MIKWHHIMYIKAIVDMVPTEFVLDVVVLYLVVQFAKDVVQAESGVGPYKNGAIRSIAQLKRQKFLDDHTKERAKLKLH